MTSEKETSILLGKGDALVVVDLQNDFLPPAGSLAVPGGDEVIPPLNRAIEIFESHALPIYFTRDWHPASHCSFVAQGGPWPPHCIAGSTGAEFSQQVRFPRQAKIVSKATQVEEDAYSGFQKTNLKDQLNASQITRVFVGGLATDYCVLNTVRDALQHGFEVVLLEDAIRAVNVHPQDGEKAK